MKEEKKIILRNSTEFIIDTGRHYWNAIDNWTNMAGMLCHWTFLSSFWKTSQHRVGTGVSVHPWRVHVTQSNLPLCLRFRRSSRPELGLLFRVFFFAVSHYAFTLKKICVSWKARYIWLKFHFTFQSKRFISCELPYFTMCFLLGDSCPCRGPGKLLWAVSQFVAAATSSRQPRCCSSLWHNIVT